MTDAGEAQPRHRSLILRTRRHRGITHISLAREEDNIRSWGSCRRAIPHAVDRPLAEVEVAQELGEDLSWDIVNMGAIVADNGLSNKVCEGVQEFEVLQFSPSGSRKETWNRWQSRKIQEPKRPLSGKSAD